MFDFRANMLVRSFVLLFSIVPLPLNGNHSIICSLSRFWMFFCRLCCFSFLLICGSSSRWPSGCFFSSVLATCLWYVHRCRVVWVTQRILVSHFGIVLVQCVRKATFGKFKATHYISYWVSRRSVTNVTSSGLALKEQNATNQMRSEYQNQKWHYTCMNAHLYFCSKKQRINQIRKVWNYLIGNKGMKN